MPRTPAPDSLAPLAAADGVGTNKLPLTVVLRLEKRGRRDTHTSYFEVQVMAPADATLESLSPFGLHKQYEGIGGSIQVKRTCFRVEQYDPQERYLLVSYSLPASRASDFEFELTWGHGYKERR